MFGRNFVVLSLYRNILKTSRRKYNWKPCYINENCNMSNNSGKIYLHCVWEDTISKKSCYNVCEYPGDMDNCWSHNFLCYIKFLIKRTNKTMDNLEILYWLKCVNENSIRMKSAKMSSFAKRMDNDVL